ncbi:putative RNA-directed DNA polymerase from transposon BS [Trichonephila clavipes]|nr:putative RNA-directed DNA polymerase from transposon BS [Trichonephila clavipes]
MWNPQKAEYLLRNILGSKVVKTNLKGLPYQLFCYQTPTPHCDREILVLLRKLERKGFHIIFSWVPGHVGILGNEQADSAARSMSDHMQRPVCYRDLKTSTQNYIHRVRQETWDQQILNKLHNIHPSTSHWAALPLPRHDVRLTRLRIGHTRFTHRHLLLGENAPECPSCKVPYSVCHILIYCPVFNRHRITFFHTSVLTLSDLVGKLPTKTFLPCF